MVASEDLREDAAKGIDKATSSRQLTHWQRRRLTAIHMSGV